MWTHGHSESSMPSLLGVGGIQKPRETHDSIKKKDRYIVRKNEEETDGQ